MKIQIIFGFSLDLYDLTNFNCFLKISLTLTQFFTNFLQFLIIFSNFFINFSQIYLNFLQDSSDILKLHQNTNFF